MCDGTRTRGPTRDPGRRASVRGLDLDAEVAPSMEQEDACLTSLELAERLPPPSLDDFLS